MLLDLKRKEVMVIRSCKSTEFKDSEISQIYDLYEAVFKERRSNDFFKEQFMNTALGYSYHAIAEDNGKIVGHNVYVPFYYLKKSERFLLVLSIDAMVHPDYQGKGIYSKLLKACESLAVSEGCKIRVGFPNENSYPIQTKAFKYHDFGTLDIYCLPVKPSSIKSLLIPFDWVSKIVAKIKMSGVSREDQEHPIDNKSYIIKRDRSAFDHYRYKWFGGDYSYIDNEKYKAVYRKYVFKGVTAIFLMDVFPLDKIYFDNAVKTIYSKHHDVPFIFYVGNLKFSPKSMFKIPKFIEPKHFHFVGKFLDDKFKTSEFLDINNWELNLSSYDLL